MPKVFLALDRSLLGATVPQQALVDLYLGSFHATPNEWRLNAWTLLRDHFDRWTLSRLWRKAPHVRFAALSRERQAIVALSLIESALRHLADVPIQHPGEDAPRPPAPELLPWIERARASLLEQLQQHEQATRPVSPLLAEWRALVASVETARALRDTRTTSQES